MPTIMTYEKEEEEFSLQQLLEIGKWEFGFSDPFGFVVPKVTIGQSTEERRATLIAVASEIVQSEVSRVTTLMNLVQINPVFGPARFQLRQNLVFTLMPFDEALTKIYNNIIKPTVEGQGLLCQRADDYKSNKAVIEDIWRAICEARIVIADLTQFNPNVMYELGVAHTVGKETILIYQTGENATGKFPFDLSHIRRIEYNNDAVGGQRLSADLEETLKSILSPGAIV